MGVPKRMSAKMSLWSESRQDGFAESAIDVCAFEIGCGCDVVNASAFAGDVRFVEAMWWDDATGRRRCSRKAYMLMYMSCAAEFSLPREKGYRLISLPILFVHVHHVHTYGKLPTGRQNMLYYVHLCLLAML